MSTGSIFPWWSPKKKVNTLFSMGWAVLLQIFSIFQLFAIANGELPFKIKDRWQL